MGVKNAFYCVQVTLCECVCVLLFVQCVICTKRFVLFLWVKCGLFTKWIRGMFTK
jgi:hypothetical protein